MLMENTTSTTSPMLNATTALLLPFNTDEDGASAENRPYPVLFWIFLGAIDIVIVFGNAFFCWLFIHYKHLRHNSNFFVLSLAIGDLLVGLSVPPCEYCALRVNSTRECWMFCGAAMSFSTFASVMNLSLIAYERVLAVKFPFRYHSKMTRRRIYRLIAIAWIIACICSTLPFTWQLLASPYVNVTLNHIYAVTVFASIFILGILIHIAYYVIVKEAKEKARSSICQGGRRRGKDPTGLKVCVVLATVFLLCWIPMAIFELAIEFQWSSQFPRWVFDVAYFILLINPCLDPLLYAYYKREFRAAVKEQVKPCFDRIRYPTGKTGGLTKRESGIRLTEKGS